MDTLIERKCLNCGSIFETKAIYVKRGHGKFCNLTCNAVHRNKLRKPKRLEKKIVWSEGIAYLIGLIASDGNLSKTRKRICITSKDMEIMNSCSHIIKHEITGNTYCISPSHRGKSTWYNYRFTSNSFYDFCEKIGLTPNKSLTIGALKIPDKYFRHFLRGVIDGDGSVSFRENRNQISTQIFSGSNSFLKGCVNLLEYYHHDSLKILPRIYRSSHYHLTRKKANYDTFKARN